MKPNSPPEIESGGLAKRRIIGLDMHPDVFTAAALIGSDAATARVEWTHHRRPQQELESWLERHVKASDLIVIEASANTFSVVERIEKAGCRAVILESQSASKVGRSYCANDRVDAVKLGRIYLSGLARIVWKPDDKTRARREVYHSYLQAVTDSTRSRQRLRSFLNEHCVRLPKRLSLTKSETLSHVLGVKKWSPLQTVLISQIHESLLQAEARRQTLHEIMAAEVAHDEKMLQIMRIFGLRVIAAYALVSFIGDINRFRTPKQLVAYIGLNPSVSESGNSKGSTRLKTHGCKPLRALLVQSAQIALRFASPLQKWGCQLILRRGRNRAVVGVARKLVVAVWYLMQGLFTPLQEVSDALARKVGKLATLIGPKNLRGLGYKSASDFKKQKIYILQNPTQAHAST